jgi:hypothetical protein
MKRTILTTMWKYLVAKQIKHASEVAPFSPQNELFIQT